MQYFEQPPVVDFIDNEIHSDSNIILYSQYMQETQQVNVQDTHLQAQQDSMILSVIEQMSEQMINHCHILTKHSLYDNIHKQALGYQNLFHLKKAQQIKPTLYDGIVMSAKHVAMPVIDDEETLILEEESRSKMFEKAKDPGVINKNISHKPIDYEKLNRLSKDFGKHFTPQQEMDAKQAFWFRISNPTIESSNPPPVKVEVPSELPKVSLVNASLKKLKFHPAQFDSMVKKRTTPDARTEGEWGFKHTKAVFNNEIILFLKSLSDIFNVFDRDLLNDIMEDVLLIVMNSMSLIGEYVNMDGKRKEFSDSLIDKLNLKSAENEDLKVQIQDKLDLEPLAPRLLQNREAYINYLKCTQEQADILWGIVKQAKAKKPLDKELDFACKHVQQIQELLVYVRDTCPNAINLRLKCSTSKCGSKPTGNKRNDRISQTPSRNMENKVEAKPRKVNKKNCVVKPIHDVDVKHLLLNANSEPICATCKKSLFDGVYDMCFLDFVKNVNSRAKSAKKNKKENIWKPTGHVFTEVGFKWKPTGRTFTIVGSSFPLTRITSANVIPPKKTTSHLVETQKQELKVYSRKPKNVKNVGLSKKAKIVESKNANHSKPNHSWGSNAINIPSSSSLVMTGCPDYSLVYGLRMFETHDRNRFQLMNFVSKFLGTVRFGNDSIIRIMGYGDYQLGNVTISRVYYVKGLGHNLFSVGQFCDADLEVAF
ncbi:hypothetical protein Tco_1042680, partial [Tanacetum coccineum]